MFLLGARVKDSITGFEGIVVSRTAWLNGCLRVGVQSTTLKDGLPQEVQHFDESQILLVELDTAETNPRRTGGPMPAPKQHPDPVRG